MAIQFAVSNPAFASTLVGTASPANIAKNAQWAQQTPDEELLATAQTILAPIRDQTWRSGRAGNNDGKAL